MNEIDCPNLINQPWSTDFKDIVETSVNIFLAPCLGTMNQMYI